MSQVDWYRVPLEPKPSTPQDTGLPLGSAASSGCCEDNWDELRKHLETDCSKPGQVLRKVLHDPLHLPFGHVFYTCWPFCMRWSPGPLIIFPFQLQTAVIYQDLTLPFPWSFLMSSHLLCPRQLDHSPLCGFNWWEISLSPVLLQRCSQGAPWGETVAYLYIFSVQHRTWIILFTQ